MKKSFVLFLVVLVGVAAVIFWWYQKSGSVVTDPVLVRIKQSGKLVVMLDPSYPPMESVDDRGQFVGFDVDFAREIANALGVSLEPRKFVWDESFPEVSTGAADMTISSITITPEREKIFLFSNPYFSSGQVLVIRDSDTAILEPKDLAGKRVIAQKDTTGARQAVLYTDPKLVSLYETSYDTAISDITAGRSDALVIDYPVAADIVRKAKGLRIAGDPFTSEFYGVVMKKGNTALSSFVNSVIMDMKTSGRFNEIKKKWFP
jgi:ABC-type amino acid transport substrate-binding protein